MSGPNSSYDPVQVTPLDADHVEAAIADALAAFAAATSLAELKTARLAHAGDRSPLARRGGRPPAVPVTARNGASESLVTSPAQTRSHSAANSSSSAVPGVAARSWVQKLAPRSPSTRRARTRSPDRATSRPRAASSSTAPVLDADRLQGAPMRTPPVVLLATAAVAGGLLTAPPATAATGACDEGVLGYRISSPAGYLETGGHAVVLGLSPVQRTVTFTAAEGSGCTFEPGDRWSVSSAAWMVGSTGLTIDWSMENAETPAHSTT